MSTARRNHSNNNNNNDTDDSQETLLANSNNEGVADEQPDRRYTYKNSDNPLHERSSISRAQVAMWVVNEKNVWYNLVTGLQLAWAGLVLGLILGTISTTTQTAFGLTAPTPALIVLEGLLWYAGNLIAARVATHYDADLMEMLFRWIAPLLSSDRRNYQDWFRREHRWHDMMVATLTTPWLICTLMGGYIGGFALVGYYNDDAADIGNPPTTGNPGFGQYDRTDIFTFIGAAQALMYLTYGAPKIVTENGHIRHWAQVYKDEEETTLEGRMKTESEIHNNAFASAIQYMWNRLLTGSPVKAEQLLAGLILAGGIGNIPFYLAALVAGWGVAITILFFMHHIFSVYTMPVRHRRIDSSKYALATSS